MKSARFEITRVVLTVIASLLLLGISGQLIFDGGTVVAKAIGWGILVLLGVGIAGMLRKRKA